jgi:hypothetical protein
MNNAPAIPEWHLSGHVIVGCNCDFGCPCNFNGRPSTGHCEGGWIWHIEDGAFGDVPLSGLNVSMMNAWPGAIHEGNGECLFLVDEGADARQRVALELLLTGQAGGPWKILRTTITQAHGPEFVPFEVVISDLASRATAGSRIVLRMEPVKNPVTKVEVHPRAILPEGFVFKEGQLGASAEFRVTGAGRVNYDYTGRYAAVGPFAYQGP